MKMVRTHDEKSEAMIIPEGVVQKILDEMVEDGDIVKTWNEELNEWVYAISDATKARLDAEEENTDLSWFLGRFDDIN
jgi:DNA-binding PadR family transcriptional regulator